MQRKRNEGGASAAKVHRPRPEPSSPQQKPSRALQKPSQHSTFFGKIAIFIECWDGLDTSNARLEPITTKVPAPIVVVLNDVLCRGLGLAALADRMDYDVQQQQHNGHDHDEHGKLTLAPVAAGQRLLLVDVLFAVLGAHAMHQ